MRTKKAFYNMITNILFYACNILFGIISRKVLLSFMGIEYQGINGLFSNILSILGIAELGIGTAIIYHLYKPLQENNIPLISSIMKFYQICYRYIAVFLTTIGLLFTIHLDFFIGENNLPINLTVVYILMLADVVASYTLTYKRSILYADQNNYIVSLADTGNIILCNLVQMFLIATTRNYFVFLSVKIVFRILENIIINFITNRRYPFLKKQSPQPLEKNIVRDIKQKVKGLLFHKIGTFVVNGTDNIIISKFINVASVGLYSNYSYIITSITGLFGQIINATTAGVGNLLVSATSSKKFQIFNELQVLNLGLTNFTTTSIFIICDSFISLFFGKQYVLPQSVVIVICFNYALTCLRSVYGIFKSAAGIQYEDRFVPIFEAALNLIASLILVKKIGFAGVFLGTSISNLCVFCYSFPKFIYRGVLKGKLKDYYQQLLTYLMFIVFNCCLSKYICNIIVFNTISLQFIFNIAVALFIPNIIFWLFYHKCPEMKYLLKRIQSIKEFILKH